MKQIISWVLQNSDIIIFLANLNEYVKWKENKYYSESSFSFLNYIQLDKINLSERTVNIKV